MLGHLGSSTYITISAEETVQMSPPQQRQRECSGTTRLSIRCEKRPRQNATFALSF